MTRIWLVFLFVVVVGCRRGVKEVVPPVTAPVVRVNEAPAAVVAPRSEARPVVETARAAAPVAVPPVVVSNIPGDVRRLVREVNGRLEDVYFDYDRSELGAEAVVVLRRNAGLLEGVKGLANVMVVVEGHCDERGSAEYNLGLGDKRASRAAGMLEEFGVAGGRVRTVSYGKEAPQCSEAVEGCWRLNRRAHFVVRVEED